MVNVRRMKPVVEATILSRHAHAIPPNPMGPVIPPLQPEFPLQPDPGVPRAVDDQGLNGDVHVPAPLPADHPEDPQPEDQYDVEEIVGWRVYRGKPQYLVKWVGYPSSANTWEPLENLINASVFIAEYEEKARVRAMEPQMIGLRRSSRRRQ